VAPLVLTVSMLGAALVARQVRRRRRVPLSAVMCALVATSVVSQPLGISPRFPGFSGNEPRISALGLIPLVLSLGVLLSLRGQREWRIGHVLSLVTIVAVASLHHRLTIVGPENAKQFLLFQVAASAVATIFIFATQQSGPAFAGGDASGDSNSQLRSSSSRLSP